MFVKGFNNLLTEEMGIIRNVQSDATIIADKIRSYIKQTTSLPSSLDNTTYKNGSFQIDVTTSADGKVSPTKKNINIKWYYYSFSDWHTLSNNLNKIPLKTSYIQLQNTLNVVIFAINGVIDTRTLEDSIAHELTHNFQRQNKGRGLLSNDKTISRYNAANKNLANSDSAIKAIANVMYLLHSFEQDAYLNGAYAYIMSEHEKGNDVTSAYAKTEAYVSLHRIGQYLDMMKKALEKGNVSERIEIHCKSEYGLDFESIIKLGDKAYSRYSRKLARMYAQALSDIRNKMIESGQTYHTMTFLTVPSLEDLHKQIDENIFA